MVELKDIEVGSFYRFNIQGDCHENDELLVVDEFVIWNDTTAKQGFSLMTVSNIDYFSDQMEFIKELPKLLETKELHEIEELDDDLHDNIVLYFVDREEQTITTCLSFDVTVSNKLTEDQARKIYRCECNGILVFGCSCPEREELEAWTCPDCKGFTVINKAEE